MIDQYEVDGELEEADPPEIAREPKRVQVDRGVYPISVASELTGLSQSTLRIYEREGLVEPARTDRGTRRYSASNIEQLDRIAELMASGMNIVGVRHSLGLQAQVERLQSENEQLRSNGSSNGSGAYAEKTAAEG